MPRRNGLHDTVIESLTMALIQLMEKKKLDDINISELCVKAGVSRVSFYRNFSSMGEILERYLTACIDAWWEEFSARPDEEFRAQFFCQLIEQYRKHADLIRLIYASNKSLIIKNHIFKSCDISPRRSDMDAYTRAALAGAIYGIVDEWIKRGMRDLPKGFTLHGGSVYPSADDDSGGASHDATNATRKD